MTQEDIIIRLEQVAITLDRLVLIILQGYPESLVATQLETIEKLKDANNLLSESNYELTRKIGALLKTERDNKAGLK